MGAQSISNHSESFSMQKSAPCRLPWPCAPLTPHPRRHCIRIGFSKQVFCDSCTRTAFLVEHPDGMLCDKCQKLCGHAHFPRKAVTGESVEGRTGEIIRWHQSDKLSKKVAASTVCFTFATSWSRSVSEPIGFALLHCDESLLLQLTLAAPGMQRTSNINL